MAALAKRLKANFYFDPVSPYAYLAFERLHAAAHKVDVRDKIDIQYRPVVLGAMLQHFGQLGPAEVPPKRDHTYRQVSYVAQKVDVPINFPAVHPFNSLALLRLAVASGSSENPAFSGPSEEAVRKILRFVWRSGDGLLADDASRLKQLGEALKPSRDPNSQAVKDELRAFTSEACKNGIFGVPTLSIENDTDPSKPAYNFWGLDCLEQGMVRDCLAGHPFFTAENGGWNAATTVKLGVVRNAAAKK